MAGKARITVTSPDAKALDDICTQIKDITKATGIALSGPVYLPTKRLMVAVRRSPCGDGSETFEHWEMRVHKELMVEDVLELMIELGLYPVGEDIHHSVDKYKNKEELDKIDVQKLLILNGKQLEEYKQYLIEYINDELDQSLYSSMLIDRIKKVSDCPGKYYSKLKINPLI